MQESPQGLGETNLEPGEAKHIGEETYHRPVGMDVWIMDSRDGAEFGSRTSCCCSSARHHLDGRGRAGLGTRPADPALAVTAVLPGEMATGGMAPRRKRNGDGQKPRCDAAVECSGYCHQSLLLVPLS
jgi:hypothetical protein